MSPDASPAARAFAVALSELSRTERLLVALDFDGTLSPLVDDPYAARVLPQAASAIAVLEELPDTWVAYVSGRPVESLAQVTEADDRGLLVGSHGGEVRLGSGAIELTLDDDQRRRLAALDAALTRIIEATPRAFLEHKPLGLGVHSRQMDPADVPALHRAAREAADDIGEFFIRDGKDILEFAVTDATKGQGLELLRERLAASGVLYAGDDVTDEDGFAVLGEGDIGVKVGEGSTLAEYRVTDPHAIAQMLALLAGARKMALSSRD